MRCPDAKPDRYFGPPVDNGDIWPFWWNYHFCISEYDQYDQYVKYKLCMHNKTFIKRLYMPDPLSHVVTWGQLTSSTSRLPRRFRSCRGLSWAISGHWEGKHPKMFSLQVDSVDSQGLFGDFSKLGILRDFSKLGYIYIHSMCFYNRVYSAPGFIYSKLVSTAGSMGLFWPQNLPA